MPQSQDKLLIKASKLLASKQYAEALALYKKICAIDRNNPAAWLATGSLAGRLGKFADAEIAFRKALTLQPGSPATADYLAQALEAQGKYSDAIEVLLKHCKNGHANNPPFFRLGILYGKAGNFIESVNFLEKHTELHPNDAHAYHCLASAYESLGDLAKATIGYNKAINLDPANHQLHNNYGTLLQKIGQWESATRHYQESIKTNPEYAIGHYNLGTVLHASGKFPQAITCYSNAVKLKPDYAEAYVGLGRSYRSSGEANLAIRCYEKALSLDSKCIAAYLNLGRALVTCGRYSESLNAYHAALELDPCNVDVTCAIAALHERRGEYEEANRFIEPLLKTSPHNMNVAITYGAISRKTGTREIAISNLKHALRDGTLSPKDRADIHSVLGKLYDDIRNYDAAFRSFRAANKLVPYTLDIAAMRDSVSRLVSLFTEDFFQVCARSNNMSQRPVFIVGMPRSGTTLVEQIIASHPKAHGAGELPHISDLARGLKDRLGSLSDYPENIASLTTGILNEMASDYLNKLATGAPSDCKRITDKMPHNFRNLGLIEMLFPHATVIHCTRNPVDNCLSIYFNNFVASHPYATSLENAAIYYTDYYQKIMSHWQRVIKLPILEVNYEYLVENQVEASRSIIAHCGLEWDDRCLRFHEAKRDVATISYDQVRQPIYKKSKERWRNYERHIQSLLDHFDAQQIRI